MHILITTNNFWVGGRETYIAEYISYLKGHGFKFSLLANSIVESVPQIELFEEVIVCGATEYCDRWKRWIENFNKLLAQQKIDLIWAHHFDLLPAWIIARKNQIPLLTTFHGPLVDVDRPNDPMQALGMILSIHRGDVVSGVSNEVTSNIFELNNQVEELAKIPNSIVIDSKPLVVPNHGSLKKFVLITRVEKLDHIRMGLQFFRTYRKRVSNCRLTIVTGRGSEDVQDDKYSILTRPIKNLKKLLTLLGAKWSYQQGLGFLPVLFHTHFYGYASDSKVVIQEADVVLGMGRVIIEGISQGKPSVLIGYDDIHGLVTNNSFKKFRWSNFSGRNVPIQQNPDVCDDLLTFIRDKKQLSVQNVEKISTAQCGMRLISLINEAVYNYKFDNMYSDFATKLEDDILGRGVDSKELFAIICKDLSSIELPSFYSLCIG